MAAKTENKDDKTVEKKDKKDIKTAPKYTPQDLAIMDLESSLELIIKAVADRERILFSRVLRRTHAIRKKLTYEILNIAFSKYDPESLSNLESIKGNLTISMEAEDQSGSEEDKAGKKDEDKKDMDIPEIKVYLRLLYLMFLVDSKLSSEAAEWSTGLINFIESFNRRTLDALSGQAYFYFSLAHENIGKLDTIRTKLLRSHRSACLQHNEPGQASLTTCILRNYLNYNLYNQADKFRLNSTFPTSASNNQYARYLFYIGKINTVQLHYSEAFNDINQAIRKAPQRGAIGFRQVANKLLVIVQMLMGEIPERTKFLQKDLERCLKPYFQLTQAVRVGDINQFGAIVAEHKATFQKDGTYSLIVRLRHNVIKTALRKINVSYSRISMKDICERLNFASEEDAEYIVAKAIADGVIDAVIDRKNHYMFSKEHVDIYSTTEPQAVYHKRIQFCLDIHNDAVKAMRFPANANKMTKKSALSIEEDKAKKEKEEKEKEKAAEEEKKDSASEKADAAPKKEEKK